MYLVLTSTHSNSTHLSSPLEVGQLLLKDDEAESKESHDQAMTSITKHHSKQERERDDSVRGCRGQTVSLEHHIAIITPGSKYDTGIPKACKIM